MPNSASEAGSGTAEGTDAVTLTSSRFVFPPMALKSRAVLVPVATRPVAVAMSQPPDGVDVNATGEPPNVTVIGPLLSN